MRTSPLRGEHAWLLVPDRALPFDPMEFPQDCKAGLVGDVEYGVPVYDLFLVEDPVTRPFVIYNTDYEEVCSLAAPTGYSIRVIGKGGHERSVSRL